MHHKAHSRDGGAFAVGADAACKGFMARGQGGFDGAGFHGVRILRAEEGANSNCGSWTEMP